MIAELNRLVETVESDLSDDVDLAALAGAAGTTEYHLRRMFSSLAGIPLSEYIRRRRMTVAAAEIVAGERDAGDSRPPVRSARTAVPFDHNRNSGSA